MKRICVFCGSNFGKKPAYRENAEKLARALAERELELVYGGGKVGLMGELARNVISAGGKVIGVVPENIYEGVEDVALTELMVVHNMHDRKEKMYELSDAFIAFPGGIGTMEEMFEIYTWSQLGLHDWPVGLLNVEGYFDQLLKFLDHSVAEGFLKASQRESLIVESEPGRLLERILEFKPIVEKGIMN